MPTISKENYLKTIYQRAQTNNEPVTTSYVASKLEVSNAATSEMAKKLSDDGLISHEKYKGIELTDNGREIALQIIRRHRLWELFLIKVLGLSWGEVHDEAEMLEHSTSELLINTIDDYLGNPKFDPHGSPIPDRFGNLPVTPAIIALTKCRTGKKYRIAKINDKSSELMNYFSRLGLELEKEIAIEDRLEFDNSITLSIDNRIHSLSEKICENVYVYSN